MIFLSHVRPLVLAAAVLSLSGSGSVLMTACPELAQQYCASPGLSLCGSMICGALPSVVPALPYPLAAELAPSPIAGILLAHALAKGTLRRELTNLQLPWATSHPAVSSHP